VIDGLSAQSAFQRRSARNITDQVDRSGSSSHFRVRSPFLAGGGSLRACAHSLPSLHSMECLWIQRPPDARAGIALALPPPAPPVTDAAWHTGAHPATLSDRAGHPNLKVRLLLASGKTPPPTAHHNPPITLLPALPLQPATPPHKPRAPRLPFLPYHHSQTLRQD